MIEMLNVQNLIVLRKGNRKKRHRKKRHRIKRYRIKYINFNAVFHYK